MTEVDNTPSLESAMKALLLRYGFTDLRVEHTEENDFAIRSHTKAYRVQILCADIHYMSEATRT